MGRVLPPLQDPRADQGAQPRGQGVARGPGALDHLVEPPGPEEDLADGQQRPLLSYDLQRAGYGTDPRLCRCRCHEPSIPRKSDFWTHKEAAGYSESRNRTEAAPGGCHDE